MLRHRDHNTDSTTTSDHISENQGDDYHYKHYGIDDMTCTNDDSVIRSDDDDEYDELRSYVNRELYDEALLMRLDAKIVSLTSSDRHEAAIALMEQGIAMRIAIYGIDSVEVVEGTQKLVLLYNTVAMTKVTAQQYKRALGLLNRAQELHKDMGKPLDHLSVQTLNNMACCHRRMGKHKLALQTLRRSMKLCAETGADGIAVTHLNMCAILSQLKRHNEALEHAQSAVLHCQEVLLSDSIHDRLNVNGTSNQHSTLTEKIVVLGIAYHNLAVEEEHLKHHENSVHWYHKALRLVEEHLGANEPITQTFRESYNDAVKYTRSTSKRSTSRQQRRARGRKGRLS